MRYDRMAGIARLAGEGVLTVPVAGPTPPPDVVHGAVRGALRAIQNVPGCARRVW